MNIIVAVDLNWAIGLKGKLLKKIPDDMKRFKEKTINNIVVMGRKTFESLPNKKPLENRINIVLTRNKNFKAENIIICHSIEELLKQLKFYNKEIYIIGGSSLYDEMLTYCDTAFVTKINKVFRADTFMKNLDNLDNWNIVKKSNEKIFEDVTYSYLTYKKIR